MVKIVLRIVVGVGPSPHLNGLQLSHSDIEVLTKGVKQTSHCRTLGAYTLQDRLEEKQNNQSRTVPNAVVSVSVSDLLLFCPPTTTTIEPAMLHSGPAQIPSLPLKGCPFNLRFAAFRRAGPGQYLSCRAAVEGSSALFGSLKPSLLVMRTVFNLMVVLHFSIAHVNAAAQMMATVAQLGSLEDQNHSPLACFRVGPWFHKSGELLEELSPLAHRLGSVNLLGMELTSGFIGAICRVLGPYTHNLTLFDIVGKGLQGYGQPAVPNIAAADWLPLWLPCHCSQSSY